MHEDMNQEAQDEMEATLKKIHNLKSIVWVLQQYVLLGVAEPSMFGSMQSTGHSSMK